ncbi:phosphodiesterase [Veronia nyctiphanis]|uniref:Phosphodiesterase n=1 Tax=Veronia nyctiphanis TaxID=1278244 RepID=A0A4Q0YQN6_9GAMM|nr:phosphodiesterase [Veronia nyctiphanis]RXJ72374.1 phosphodiesterase [Veronia nyctiphanis]
MMKLIHLTDPHIVPEHETLFGLKPYQRLRLAIDSINREHGDADLVVITGDLTHKGQPEAYQLLKQELSNLLPPLALLPGNHDDNGYLCEYFPELQTDSEDFIQRRLTLPAGELILLDTTIPGTHIGHYGEQKRKWLEAELKASHGRDVYLFAHHTPFDMGLKPLDNLRIPDVDAAPFISLLRQHSNIKHYFFGHLHRPLSGSFHGIPFSTLRGTAHQVWLDFTSQTEIPGSHEQAAFVLSLSTRTMSLFIPMTLWTTLRNSASMMAFQQPNSDESHHSTAHKAETENKKGTRLGAFSIQSGDELVIVVQACIKQRCQIL